MTLLYQEQDLEAIKAQQKKRLISVSPVWAVLLAVVIYSCITRAEWLTMLSLCLLGACLVFWLDFLYMPLHRYEVHLKNALHGRHHDTEYEFSAFDEDQSVVDGVKYRGMTVLGEADRHGIRDRMFYWDCERELPDFKEGAVIKLRYYDKVVIGYEA